MASYRLLQMVLCLSILLLCWGTDVEGQAREAPLRWETDLLRSHNIEPTADGALTFLARLTPNKQTLQLAQQLIADLGCEDFQRRRNATRKLLEIGDSVESQVKQAADSQNLEQSVRARRILAAYQATRDSGLRGDLILSALRILKQKESKRTPKVVFSLLAVLSERHLIDAAKEALWASIDAQHAELIRSNLRDVHPARRTTAIVALELAVGADSVTELEAFLKSDHPQVRLATARALLNRRPRQCLISLGRLVSLEEFEIHAHAACLMRDLTGETIGVDGTSDFSTAVEEWQKWLVANGDSARLQVPVGRERLDLLRAMIVFRENFRNDVTQIQNSYGRFRYESTIPTNASVARNRLQLDGNHGEADQRLFVMSRELTGGRAFPSQFSVSTKMGGGPEGSGAYHVGLSVGRIKVLFHPGYSGGGFRVETTDDHDYLINNSSMGFTPKGNVLYPVKLTVKRQQNGRVEFVAEVRKAPGSEQVYTKRFALDAEVVGPVNRIGLERSGRKGGVGMFENVEIDFSAQR